MTHPDPLSPAAFAALLILSTAVDGLVAVAALRALPGAGGDAGPRRIDLAGLTAAATATAAAFVAKLLPLGLAGVNIFGMIHLVYVDMTVLLPLLGLAILVAAARRGVVATRGARAAAIAALGLLPVGVYATWVEPFRLRVESAQVGVDPRRGGDGPLRIGVLADLQTARVTDYERRAVARLMAQRPDVILLPGDLFQGSPAEFDANRDALRDILSQLKAPGGVYFVLGDFDAPGPPLEPLLHESGIRLLIDEVVRVNVKGRGLTIGGVQLDVTAPSAQRVVETLETAPGEGDVRILMAHRPDVALGLRQRSRVDLVVAGHTHGGQVVVPGLGPPLTLTHVPRKVAAGGLHRLGGNAIYVSRGVGCERGQAPRIRFLCPPEVSLLEIRVRDTR